MGENKYLWAVLFGVLFVIGIEYLIARRKGLKIFRFQNTISNISMGVFDRIAGLMLLPLTYLLYDYIYQNFAILSIPETTTYFVVAIFVTDFVWYLYHRSGHKVNLFWGAHIIHHQSEDYNYSVALNLTPIQVLVRILFWSLMPIVGFTPKIVIGTQLFIGLYQFLLHTTLIPKLGFLEKFMVTPSHHRVHHGSNDKYLDKNFGGIFIVWDKLFGSFQEEEEEVVYGITKDLNTREFLMSIFHYYGNLRFQMKQLSWKNKILLLFKPPDWIPDSGEMELSSTYIDKGTYKYEIPSVAKTIYSVLSLLFVLLLLSYTGYHLNSLSNWNIGVLSILMLMIIVIVSRKLESKKVILLEISKYLIILYLLFELTDIFNFLMQ